MRKALHGNATIEMEKVHVNELAGRNYFSDLSILRGPYAFFEAFQRPADNWEGWSSAAG